LILRHLDLRLHQELILARGAQAAAQQDPAVLKIYLIKKGNINFFDIALFYFL